MTPPTLFEKLFQLLARTDMGETRAYEAKVRAYHAELKHFYYPKLFGHQPFEKRLLKDLPCFDCLED
jgi:ABC-2 type transport system permease protein